MRGRVQTIMGGCAAETREFGTTFPAGALCGRAAPVAQEDGLGRDNLSLLPAFRAIGQVLIIRHQSPPIEGPKKRLFDHILDAAFPGHYVIHAANLADHALELHQSQGAGHFGNGQLHGPAQFVHVHRFSRQPVQ